MSSSRPLPLDGVVVLDLGQIYQGPYAGFLLAQSGARVIKVEPPQGESARGRGPTLPFAMLNSGKECITLDLKSTEGVVQFKQLVRTADVVLMNYAPGVPERLGIGYDVLSDVNPRLVYAHACGFGVRNLDGSPTESTIPAMDLTVQAHSGSMSTTGHDHDPPLKSGTAFIDFLGGTHLFGAITTALFEVERTGQGRSVEVAMADAAYFTLATHLSQWQQTGTTMRNGNRHAGLGMAPYNVYECADGHLAIICVANRHWRALLTAIDRDDLLDDDRLRGQTGRAEHMVEVDAIVTAWSSQLPKFEAADILQKAHVPAAAVRTVDEIVHDERQIERRAIQWINHPDLGDIPLHTSPIRWHDSELSDLVANRSLGADNERVFGEFSSD
ncbi:MAG: CoA transferase [Acidimicrobiaceae bacterium]|nr:CoA transferase [Acidimicrobiaceae bacterium]MDC1388569.1 CoA transferase [Acidimicrobiales bacterium]